MHTTSVLVGTSGPNVTETESEDQLAARHCVSKCLLRHVCIHAAREFGDIQAVVVGALPRVRGSRVPTMITCDVPLVHYAAFATTSSPSHHQQMECPQHAGPLLLNRRLCFGL